jgi:hypothetical protein
MTRIVTLFLLATLGCSDPQNLGCDVTSPECVAVCGGPAVDTIAGPRCTCPSGTFFKSECEGGTSTADGSAGE